MLSVTCDIQNSMAYESVQCAQHDSLSQLKQMTQFTELTTVSTYDEAQYLMLLQLLVSTR